MDFANAREMVRLRHELRRLLVDRRPEEARAVLARLEALATADAEESAVIRPEIARWQTSLALEGDPEFTDGRRGSAAAAPP